MSHKTINKNIKKIILRASSRFADDYAAALQHISNEDVDTKAKARANYNASVLKHIHENMTDILVLSRFDTHIQNPAACGYPHNVNTQFEFSAGAIYAALYQATTGEPADPQECLDIDFAQRTHLQRAIDSHLDTVRADWLLPVFVVSIAAFCLIGLFALAASSFF